MNSKEAKQYFQEMGQLLRSEPDINERRRFSQQIRQEDPQYQEAFTILREEAQSKKQSAEAEPCFSCPFDGKPATMGELVEEFAGKPVVGFSVVGHTTYDADVIEFDVDGLRHVIIPIRITDIDLDFREAVGIVAGRCHELGTPSNNFYPFLRP